MELYGYYRSSTSYRLRIALALKGIEYRAHYVSLPDEAQRSPDYLAVNPQGLVPTLIDEGTAYTQSLALLEYLDETHPEPPLLPPDAGGRAQVRALAQIVGCEIHPLNNLRVLKYLKGPLALDEAARDRWYRHWMGEGLDNYENSLARLDEQGGRSAGRSYGDSVTIADICLVPQIFNAQRFRCPLEAYPRTMAVFEACMALPAFETTQPKHQPDAVS
ncbi:MAG: maleylacetoacetate isomerase [Tistlia sp.]|uniref:maleylacetoacetate isomerase n=1 Tax=Tistlia sp. TaxID=3057121 RepID=UPI0034A20FEA